MKSRYFLGISILLCFSCCSPSTEHEKVEEYLTIHQLCASPNATVEELNEFLQLNVDVNSEDSNGSTPLLLATANNTNPNFISTLVKAGADVTLEGEIDLKSLFGKALGRNHLPSIREWSDAMTDSWNSPQRFEPLKPLCVASMVNNAQVVAILIKSGADVNETYSGAGQGTSLCIASRFNDRVDVIITLLRAGADSNFIDNHGQNPLHLSAMNSSFKVTRTLLDAGVDVNARNKEGNTPLMIATTHNSKPVVEMLIDAETADDGKIFVNNTESGETILMYAAANPSSDIILLFLRSFENWEIDAQDSFGLTPLMIATSLEREKNISILLQAGASPHIRNEDGFTAFELARNNGYLERTDAYQQLRNATIEDSP